MNKEKKSISRGVMFLLLLVYLLAAWILFSKSGFLPRFISAPVSADKQEYTHVYNRMGYSETYLRNHINDNIVEKGAINKLGILKSGNVGGGVYYSEKEDLYYVSDNDTIYTVDKNENRKPVLKNYSDTDSFIRYGNFLVATGDDRYTITLIHSWSNIRSIDGSLENMTYSYNYDKESHEFTDKTFNYKYITGILEKNETEKISLTQLAAVVNAASDGELDYWDPEEKTALFHTCDDDGNREVYNFTAGDEEVTHIGSYPYQADDSWYPIGLNRFLVWERGEEKDSISVFDCLTNKKTFITEEAPILSQIRYRVKKSGEIALAGIVKYRNGEAEVWVYDGDLKDTLTIKLRVLYDKTFFSLGKDSVMQYTVKPDDKTACTIYHTPIEMMKGD